MRVESDAGQTFSLDGQDLDFNPGDTVLQAATRAHRYIPHLCWHPDFAPHGSCREPWPAASLSSRLTTSAVPTLQGVQKPQLSCAKKWTKLRATSNRSRL